MVRSFKLGSRQDEADREKERFESRCFSVFPDEEGMYVVKGRLTPEVGALLMRAVEAASDALYRPWGGRARRPCCRPIRWLRSPKTRAADPDFHTAGARWKREADISGDVYLRAMEAIGQGPVKPRAMQVSDSRLPCALPRIE